MCSAPYTFNTATKQCEKPLITATKQCLHGDTLSSDQNSCSYGSVIDTSCPQGQTCTKNLVDTKSFWVSDGSIGAGFGATQNTRGFQPIYYNQATLTSGSTLLVTNMIKSTTTSPNTVSETAVFNTGDQVICQLPGTTSSGVNGSCSGTLISNFNHTTYDLTDFQYIIEANYADTYYGFTFSKYSYNTCPNGGILSGNVCVYDAVCPTGFTLDTTTNTCYVNDGLVSFITMTSSIAPICPKGSANTLSGICSYDSTCPVNQTLNKNTNVCEKDPINSCSIGNLINSNNLAGTNQTCADATVSCDTGSWLLNGTCVSDKTVICGVAQTYNSTTKKCEGDSYCPQGYVGLNNSINCKRDYTYSTYSCPTGYSDPLNIGGDCGGTCGFDGCSCNSTTPPANNCKKAVDLSTFITTVTKKRDLMIHTVIPSNKGLTPLEYGNVKGFNCGDSCSFDVVKIRGIDDALCFYKKNNESECFHVAGCSFSGEISSDKIQDINLPDKNTIALTPANTFKPNTPFCSATNNTVDGTGFPTSTGSIKSTCSINGHVGWHSRTEGISSITANKDRILFWDGYKDGNLGFLEFVKEAKPADATEGFIPENILPYTMESSGFTASEFINGNTYFVSADEISTSQCNNMASTNNLIISDPTIDSNVFNTLKILSGDRTSASTKDPVCNIGIFDKNSGTCINISDSATCANGYYDKINFTSSSTFLSTYGIWDYTQGDTITLNGYFYGKTQGSYLFEAETLGSASIYIDGNSIGMIADSSGHKTATYNLGIGIHSIKIVATGSGNKAIALTVSDPSGQIISRTSSWCNQNRTESIPTTVKSDKSCPLGGTLNTDGITCNYPATLNYTCATGSISGNTCITSNPATGTPVYSCNGTDTLSGTTCSYSSPITTTPTCLSPEVWNVTTQKCEKTVVSTYAAIQVYNNYYFKCDTTEHTGVQCLNGNIYDMRNTPNGNLIGTNYNGTTLLTPYDGWEMQACASLGKISNVTYESNWNKTVLKFQAPSCFTLGCNGTDTLSGSTCSTTTLVQDIGTCPANYTLINGVCSGTQILTYPANQVTNYSCTTGTLSGSNCLTTTPASPVYSCSNGNTLSGNTCSYSATCASGTTPVSPCSGFFFGFVLVLGFFCVLHQIYKLNFVI
jgi:hypothetical protein